MAYREHFLLAFGGTLYGDEIWQCSLRMARENMAAATNDIDGQENMLDDILGDVQAFVGSSAFNNKTVLTWVKFNKINETGHYSHSSHTSVRHLSGATGTLAAATGTSTTMVAPQLALAVSLHTDKMRGPGSRGRFFLPAPPAAASIGADGRIAPPNVGNPPYAQIATFLANLNNFPGIDVNAPRIVVATPGGRGMPDGDNVAVTGWSVGRVIDTQRRRRNDLAESPAVVAL